MSAMQNVCVLDQQRARKVRVVRRLSRMVSNCLVVAVGWLAAGDRTLGGDASRTTAKPARPNIVFAMADDWGWPHAGAYGDKVVKTPTFDRVAREGVLFTNAYVSSPSCTPCRSSIVTGQHFWRLQAGGNLHSNWPKGQFAEFPKLLADAGYHMGTYRKSWGPGNGNPAGKPYKSAEEFFDARPDEAPFCFWFGSSDPHRGYKLGSGKASGMNLEDVHLFGHFPDVREIRSDVADYYWEVQRFDRQLGELLELVAAAGELENTIVVVTGDHGMPFPRCKGNLYDCGVRVPLAIRWPSAVGGGRTVTDFVSLTDVAPTFLSVAGVAVPEEMTGRSLMKILASEKSGRIDTARNHVLVGRERHVPAQEAPESGGYPMRAIRTDDYLYIRNFQPDRWPAGTPNYQKAYFKNCWLGDCDNGPTKTYIWRHRNDPAVQPLYDLCFGKRPAEELYELRNDPDQLNNVAGMAKYQTVKDQLSRRLTEALRATADPRIVGGGEAFDTYPYLGRGPLWQGG